MVNSENHRPPSVNIQASSWQKISKLIVYFCVVRSFEKEDFLENLRILSCLIQVKSIIFNLLCVFDHARGQEFDLGSKRCDTGLTFQTVVFKASIHMHLEHFINRKRQ